MKINEINEVITRIHNDIQALATLAEASPDCDNIDDLYDTIEALEDAIVSLKIFEKNLK